jgi:hypothetical protein
MLIVLIINIKIIRIVHDDSKIDENVIKNKSGNGYKK